MEEDKKEELDPERKDIEAFGSRYRVLDLFARLLDQEEITIEWAKNFYGKEEAIKKDFRILRKVLSRQMPDAKLVLDKETEAYHLKRKGVLSTPDALAILKMMIGIRAFSKDELTDIFDDILLLVDEDDRQDIKILLATTLYNYKAVKVSDDLRECILKMSKYILNKKAISFTYNSSRKGSNSKKEIVGVPINMYFDTSYYYVMIYLLKDANSKDNPRIFRLDRFNLPITEKRKSVNIPYSKKVDEGAMLNKTHLLKMGNDVTYKFEYFSYPQTALDKLPGSKIVEVKDNSVVISGSIFSEGALLWIFSQGNQLKVLEPSSLVEEVKQRLHDTLDLYED